MWTLKPDKHTNAEFYKSELGGTIMNANNFDEEIISFLRAETAFISKILGTSKYDVLLEVGCANAMHYNTAIIHQAKYIGIDIRVEAINILKRLNYNDAKFYHLDLTNLTQIQHIARRDQKKFLCIFPFNLIGNFEDINKLLASYKQLNLDIIISAWQPSSKSANVRYKYYSSCGIGKPELLETPSKQCFKTNNFFSNAYSADYLITNANKNNYKLITQYSNELIQCFYFTCNT